jgi:hypothetical protein
MRYILPFSPPKPPISDAQFYGRLGLFTIVCLSVLAGMVIVEAVAWFCRR